MPSIALGAFQIHYTLTGGGEVLLLFPDNLHAAQAYEQQSAHFAARFRVLAFDYPGFGGSSHAWLYPDELDEEHA